MRRSVPVLLCLALLLAGCASTPPATSGVTASTTAVAAVAGSAAASAAAARPTETAVPPTATSEPTVAATVTSRPTETATSRPTETAVPPTATSEPTSTPTATPLAMTGTANGKANVRAYPDTERGAVIGSVPAGSALDIVGKTADGGWFVVRTADGATGYISAQVVTVAPEVAAAAAVQDPGPPPARPTRVPPTEAPAARSDCDPSYPDVCIPSPPPDLDCGDIPYRRFRVVGADPHRFDGDNDGIGCER